jgi:hypothetical protein
MWSRSFDLPPYWAALTTNHAGSTVVHPTGGQVLAGEHDEMCLIRTHPVTLTFDLNALRTKDGFDASARVVLSVQAIVDRSEMVALRERLVGERGEVAVEDIKSHLGGDVLRAVRAYCSSCTADAVVAGVDLDAMRVVLDEHLSGGLFQSGMQLIELRQAQVDSASYLQKRTDLRRQAEARDAEVAREHLASARRAAHSTHLEHLDGALGKLQELADRDPTTRLANLVQTFDPADRGALYEALWDCPTSQRTEWIVVACGPNLVCISPTDLKEPARTINCSGPAGPLRSICAPRESVPQHQLLAGCATGVQVVDVGTGQVLRTCLADTAESTAIRGGFNAATIANGSVIGTHSELGVIAWNRDGPGTRLFEDLTDQAEVVRNARTSAAHLWFTIDDTIYRVSAADIGDPNGALRPFATTGSAITALYCDDIHVVAGTADGRILSWAAAGRDADIIHRGPQRAVESLDVLSVGGIDRLVFADTSVAIRAMVLGDAYACQFGAGGQILRRAECSADIIVATNEVRDRLFVWPTARPEAQPTCLPISRWTGHSIQDVCLVSAI